MDDINAIILEHIQMNVESDVKEVLAAYAAGGIKAASEKYCIISECRDLKRWEQTAFREACRKAMRKYDQDGSSRPGMV